MTPPESAAVVTSPASALRSTVAWTAASVGVALAFVLLAPRLGLVCGALVAIAGLLAWSVRRPELLVIGAVTASMLGSFGRVVASGTAAITVYQAVFIV